MVQLVVRIGNSQWCMVIGGCCGCVGMLWLIEGFVNSVGL